MLPSFDPIPQNTLGESVADRLRAAIISGELEPGQKLSEPAVASQMDVSRSPVREALQQLQNEGLVVRQRNRTVSVWVPTPDDVDEIQSLRAICECLAAEWAIPKMNEADRSHLRDLVSQQQQALQTGDNRTIVQLDWDFHEYFCYRAGHARLMNWWQEIRGQAQVLIFRRLRECPGEVFMSLISDHMAVLEATERRDVERVQALHRSVSRRVSEAIKQILRSDGQLPEGTGRLGRACPSTLGR